MNYEFKCPGCGGSRLEEVMVDVTVLSTVAWIEEDGGVVYSDQRNEDGEVVRYQCEECGTVLCVKGEKITTAEELAAWLKKHGSAL